MLSKAQLNELANSLPSLTFNTRKDSAWKKIPDAIQYLDDYHIHFEQEFKALKHGFGRLDLANFSVATHYWIPKNAEQTLVLVHGYFDHVGVFNHIIQHALQKKFAVLAFDLPGHGLSSGETGAINSFDQYTQVLAELVEQATAHLPQPLFAAGQSTGSAVLLNYVWRNQNQSTLQANPSTQQTNSSIKKEIHFEKIFLCSPLILARSWRGWKMGAVAYEVLKHFITHLKRGSSNSSHSAEFNQFVQAIDPLQSKRISLRWIGAMKDWHNKFKTLPVLQQTLFIVQGDQDGTVDFEYNIPLIKTKLPKAQVEYIAGAGHQLVNETAELREQVFQKMDDYFLK